MRAQNVHALAGRLLAAAIALAALAGVAINFANLVESDFSAAAASWRLAGYFTILTNVALVGVYGIAGLKGGDFDHPRLFAWATSAILLVGVVYITLLHGIQQLAGARVLANALLHYVTPVLTLVHWLGFVRRGALAWRDPLVWMTFPLVYLPYALMRGMAEGHYAYPFLDADAVGARGVVLNCAGIALGFLLAGAAMVLLDRLLAKARR